MAFLTDADFTDNNLIGADAFGEVFPNGIPDSLQQMVEEEITGYVNQRYVPNVLFSGSNRSSILVMYMADMVMYHGHSSINSRDVPVIRENRYKAAMNFLKEVMLGRINPPNWPRIEDEGDDRGAEIGSRYNSSWYKGIQPH